METHGQHTPGPHPRAGGGRTGRRLTDAELRDDITEIHAETREARADIGEVRGDVVELRCEVADITATQDEHSLMLRAILECLGAPAIQVTPLNDAPNPN